MVFGKSISMAFEDKYRVTDAGCWEWTAFRVPAGYGQIKWRGRTRVAHCVVYETLVGPVPDGLELDHVCKNRACVNPAHLEPVTHAENMRRGAYANKTHCKSGHAFTPDNTYTHPTRGTRDCLTCRRKATRKHYEKGQRAV